MRAARLLPALLALVPALGCAAAPRGGAADASRPAPPIPGAEPADHLIQPGEERFAHLWKLTSGGENAEAYWSPDGRRLSLQRRAPADGIDCDQIFVTDAETGALERISPGGVTTCAYFLPDGERVVFASTHAEMEGCPPPPDWSEGYTWRLFPEYELWVRDLRTGALLRLTDSPGYDAEATVSPRGDRIVFTSTRSGDLELWTCDLEGGDLVQVTDRVGYDGGAFFSHDGERLVFRATTFDDTPEGDVERYRELLADWKIRPHRLDVYVCDADGSDLRRVTDLGGASWSPSFFPGDERIAFSSNHHDPDPSDGIDFDLFAIDVDGTGLERITTYEGFDAFPLFSPDGRWLAFSSNRGGSEPGETNVFVAAWR